MDKLLSVSLASLMTIGSAQAALTMLDDPTSATASTEHSAPFLVTNLFDGTPTLADVGSTTQNGSDYAGSGVGPHVVVYDMGSSIELAGIFYSQRVHILDAVTSIEFWVESSDPGSATLALASSLGASDHTINLAGTDNNLTEYDFGGVVGTGQYVVMRLNSPSTFNPGGGELQLATTASVPEPSSTALLGLGTLGLLLRRRR